MPLTTSGRIGRAEPARLAQFKSVFAAVAGILFLSAALNVLIKLAERWATPWRAAEESREVAV